VVEPPFLYRKWLDFLKEKGGDFSTSARDFRVTKKDAKTIMRELRKFG
jgi:hypothetical protein